MIHAQGSYVGGLGSSRLSAARARQPAISGTMPTSHAGRATATPPRPTATSVVIEAPLDLRQQRLGGVADEQPRAAELLRPLGPRRNRQRLGLARRDGEEDPQGRARARRDVDIAVTHFPRL